MARRIVSVSLGSSKRNKASTVTFEGEEFSIERVGTDGDREKFKALMEELDGQVDALGVGGADLWVVVGEKRYEFSDVRKLVSAVKTTPVVDGSGLKHTLERRAINWLSEKGIVDWPKTRVLLVSAVDRYGMAQALDQAGAQVVYGDLLFGLGLPIPIRTYAGVQKVAKAVLPIVTKCPIQWFYPTGAKQEERTPKFEQHFKDADLIAGDWHYIRRYAPDDLKGKTILTQTVREADQKWLTEAGVWRLITTTPTIDGGTFATNVMEGVLITILGRRLTPETQTEDMAELDRLGWVPHVTELNPPVN